MIERLAEASTVAVYLDVETDPAAAITAIGAADSASGFVMPAEISIEFFERCAASLLR